MTQNEVLNGLLEAGTSLSLYLINGVRLSGITIESYDTYTLKLRSNGETQLVYKANIVTIVPETEFADRNIQEVRAFNNNCAKKAPKEVEVSVKRRRRVG